MPWKNICFSSIEVLEKPLFFSLKLAVLNALFETCFILFSLQLAMSPTARATGEPVVVTTDTHLTSKIEGVIQHGQKPGRKHRQPSLYQQIVSIFDR